MFSRVMDGSGPRVRAELRGGNRCVHRGGRSEFNGDIPAEEEYRDRHIDMFEL